MSGRARGPMPGAGNCVVVTVVDTGCDALVSIVVGDSGVRRVVGPGRVHLPTFHVWQTRAPYTFL